MRSPGIARLLSLALSAGATPPVVVGPGHKQKRL